MPTTKVGYFNMEWNPNFAASAGTTRGK